MKRTIFTLAALSLFAVSANATDFTGADQLYGWNSSTGQFYQTWTAHITQLGTDLSGTFAAALGADDNYVTDAQLIVIGNTSGTNTGDQSGSSIASAIDISGTTARSAFESGDKLLIYEAGVGNRQIDYDDLPSGSTTQLDALTDVTGEGTEGYMLYDDGDGTYSFQAAPSGTTDDQGITEFTLTGDTLSITLEDDAGGQKTVDLSGYADAASPTFTGTITVPTVTGTTCTGTNLITVLNCLIAEFDGAVDISAGTGITISTGEISVTADTYQAYDANMITWPSAVDATEVGYLDGLSEALSTSLAAKQDSLSFTTTGLTAGSVYYMASGGSWTAADADGTGTYPARCVAVSTTQCVMSGQYTSTSHGLTVGATLWLSTTAGEYTTTQPSTSGDAVQALGWVLDANTLVFDVSPDYATVE